MSVNLLYSAAYALLLVFSLPYWLMQMLRKGKYRAGFGERMGAVPDRLERTKPSLWIHAVSVGEVLAVSKVVRELRIRYPEFHVYVSTTTLAGQKLARQRFGENGVFYFPLDLGFAIRRYLRALRPKLIVIAETEFWPNFIHYAHRSGATIAIINSRISDRSLPGYRRFRRLLRNVLGNIDLFLAQSASDASRLIAIGAPSERVQVSGNLKFDVEPPKETALVAQLRGALSARPVLVCGSTVEREEEILLSALKKIRRHLPELLMVLAPRHPERFEAVAQMILNSGIEFYRRTGWSGGRLGDGVFLLDSIGELASVYALATIALVGGSLVPRGGHNILEPAWFGKAIVVGPHTANFREIIQIFSSANAVRISSEQALAETLLELLGDQAQCERLGMNAKAVMQANQGSTARTITALESLLEKSSAPRVETWMAR